MVAKQLNLNFDVKYFKNSAQGINSSINGCPRKPSKDEQRARYISNLTAQIYNFYGGNVFDIAFLEDDPNSAKDYKRIDAATGNFAVDAMGNPILEKHQSLKKYLDKPGLSIVACRILAERIVDTGNYISTLTLLNQSSYVANKREKAHNYFAGFAEAPDDDNVVHLELRKRFKRRHQECSSLEQRATQ